MKTINLTFSILFYMYCSVFGQKNDTIKIKDNQKPILFESSSDEAKAKFDRDLKLNTLKIYLLGGIKSVIQKEDAEFAKKYKVQYYDFGCTPPSNFKIYEQYNHLVFNYLQKEHGKSWIPFVNKNAFGFAKWKPS